MHWLISNTRLVFDCEQQEETPTAPALSLAYDSRT